MEYGFSVYATADMGADRLVRVIRLMQFIQDGSTHSRDNLARRLGVSRRTLYRDLHVLKQAGVMLRKLPGRGLVLERRSDANNGTAARGETDD